MVLLRKTRTGRSTKISERGGRIVCRAANKLRFGTLKLLIKAIVKNIRQSDICRTGINYIIRKLYINRSFQTIEEKENLLFQQATARSIFSGSENIVNCSFTTGKMLYYLTSLVLA